MQDSCPDSHPPPPAHHQSDVVVAVLAAGQGTRMRSERPKHLHAVAGVPIVERVIHAGIASGAGRVVVMVGDALAHLDQTLGMAGEFTTVVQGPPQGTADSVRQALDQTPDASWIVSLLGDSPLLTSEVVRALLTRARSSGSNITLLTCMTDDAASYGRIERDGTGRVQRIVELSNDDPFRRTGATEINSGVMVLNATWARHELEVLSRDPVTGEYLLTDLVEVAVRQVRKGQPWPVDAHIAEPAVALGVNDRVQLAEVDAIARRRIREYHMRNGVTIIGPESVFIDEYVRIGTDTVLYPNTIVRGATRIGARCEIGPSAMIEQAELGDDVKVDQSTIRQSWVGNASDIGPYAHVRGGCRIGHDVHIGSYAELKNATLQDGAKCGHVSYLGDVRVGEHTNIGAGTITANYDGERKHPTSIGAHAFIGSDSVLVAPVMIGDRARTGAGSVVTHDVADDVTVKGVPARPDRSAMIPHDNKHASEE